MPEAKLVTARVLDVLVFSLMHLDKPVEERCVHYEYHSNKPSECQSWMDPNQLEGLGKEPCFKVREDRTCPDGSLSQAWDVVPRYSTDLEQAFKLVDFVLQDPNLPYPRHQLMEDKNHFTTSRFFKDNIQIFAASARTRAAAICLAFCKLYGQPAILES